MPTARIGKDRNGGMFYFVHVPRTAGTAMTEWLGVRRGISTFMVEHTRAVELRELGKLKDSWCFAVVRNPWDRAVSQFYWDMEHLHRGNPCRDGDHLILFELWIESERAPRILKHKRFSAHSMLCDPETDVPIPRHVLRYESLSEELAPLMPDLKRYSSGGMPEVNASPYRNGRHYTEFFRDPQTKAAVGEWMKKDCEIFGYSYE